MIRGDPREEDLGPVTSPRTTADATSGFVKAMSDAGLKPVVVYHNLAVSELYEKVPVIRKAVGQRHCNTTEGAVV